MEKIKNKNIKKMIFFIMPLILTIYQVYLVNRIWHFGTKVTFMIGMFFMLVLYCIFYLFFKNIDSKKIKKKSKTIIVITSIIVSLLVLVTNLDFFSKKYIPTTVSIYYDKESKTVENKKIPIKGMVIDNVPQTIEDEEKTGIVELSFSNCKEIIILLEKEETSEPIFIKDGEEEIQVQWQANTYSYLVQSNKTMSFFSIIRLLLSFIMIELLTYILCFSIYYLYKEKKSLLLLTLAIIAIIRIIFYQETVLHITYNDSLEYQNYSVMKLFSGELQDRTPLYPLFLKVFMFICDDLWKNFVCIAQMILSFLSLIYLYKALRLMIKWETLIAIITFLYGSTIAVIGWDTALLTESIALSTTILFCYFIISYIKTTKLKYGVLSAILIFLMTFLRPSFIGFVAILFAFFLLKIIVDKTQRKKDTICLITSTVTIIMILGYMIAFYQQHDIFSITKASVRQDLYVCMHQGFYKNSKDEKFIKDVEESMQTQENQWQAMIKILGDYGNKRVQELVKISKKESRKQYIEYLINLVNIQSNEYFDSYYNLCVSDLPNIKYNFVRSFMFLKFSTVYIITMIEAAISLFLWIKNKRPDWIHLGLFGFITAILVTSFIGTNAEFMRTAICVVPFSYMAIGIIISEGIEKYKKEGNE